MKQTILAFMGVLLSTSIAMAFPYSFQATEEMSDSPVQSVLVNEIEVLNEVFEERARVTVVIDGREVKYETIIGKHKKTKAGNFKFLLSIYKNKNTKGTCDAQVTEEVLLNVFVNPKGEVLNVEATLQKSETSDYCHDWGFSKSTLFSLVE